MFRWADIAGYSAAAHAFPPEVGCDDEGWQKRLRLSVSLKSSFASPGCEFIIWSEFHGRPHMRAASRYGGTRARTKLLSKHTKVPQRP